MIFILDSANRISDGRLIVQDRFRLKTAMEMSITPGATQGHDISIAPERTVGAITRWTINRCIQTHAPLFRVHLHVF